MRTPGQTLQIQVPGPPRNMRGRLSQYMSDEIETRLLKSGAVPRPSFVGADPDDLLDDQLYRARLLGLGRLVLSVESLAEILCETEDSDPALSAPDNDTVNWWLNAARERPLRLDLPSNQLSSEQRRSYHDHLPGSELLSELESSSETTQNRETMQNGSPQPLATVVSLHGAAERRQSRPLAMAAESATVLTEEDRRAEFQTDDNAAAPEAPALGGQKPPGPKKSSSVTPASGKLGLKAVLLTDEDEDGDDEPFSTLFEELAPSPTDLAEMPPAQVMAGPTADEHSPRPAKRTSGVQAIRDAFRGILGEETEPIELTPELPYEEEASHSAPSLGLPEPSREALDTAESPLVEEELATQPHDDYPPATQPHDDYPPATQPHDDYPPATQPHDDQEPGFTLPAGKPLEARVTDLTETTLETQAALWMEGLSGASGAVSWDSLSSLFHSNYLPLQRMVSQLPEPSRTQARQALTTWASSFESCYLRAFEQLKAGAPRPSMVLDAPNLAFRLSRQVGARNLKLVLVDSLRSDVGLMAWEKLRLQIAGHAEWIEGGTLWSALPATTATQLELIARGAEGLRGPLMSGLGEQQLVSSAEGRRLRPMRVGPHPLLKLDAVQLRVRDEEHWSQTGLESLAADVATSVGREMRKQAPGTLLLVFGDHGFVHNAADAGDARPEQVLVPYSAWLTEARPGESAK